MKIDPLNSWMILSFPHREEAEEWRDRLSAVVSDEAAFLLEEKCSASIVMASDIGPAHEFYGLFVKTENVDLCHGTRRLADHLRGWMRGFDAKLRNSSSV